ncbi:hypothetical protein SBV1_1230007 [Verrucomicrobia bacterium]|nr:hypothetical protein SBV1_1230007 [Verrucomicrobiota bacterium]
MCRERLRRQEARKGQMQAAPKATGVFTNIPGATSPYAVSTVGPRMLCRLQANQ